MSQDWMDALREATEPPDEAVAELHARVLGGVGRGRRWWPYWATLAAAVLLIAVWVGSRPAEVEVLALRRPAGPVAPVVSFTRVVERTPLPRGRGSVGRVVERRAHDRGARGAAWIRLETADPNVVILLVSEGDGE